jgi:hypothetical protein
LKNSPRKGGKVLKNLTPEGGKVLKKSSGKGPYVLRTDTRPLARFLAKFDSVSDLYQRFGVTFPAL